MGRAALVTGAYGFLGRHVARSLAADGFRVVGIGHGAWALDESRHWGISEWHTADVTLDALITYGGSPDAIVHCASSGSVGFSVTHPHQDFRRTVGTAASVLEYARLYATGASLVYPSSAAVYGVAERLPIKEDDRLHPLSPYGVHKFMAEELFRSYASSYQMRVSIVRFFSLYGEGLRKQLLWDACCKAARGEATFFGSGEELRDWLHVDDAVSLIGILIRDASPSCPIFNGGSGQGVTVREVLTDVFAVYGCNESVSFSGEPRPGDPPGYHADISKAIGIGWQPNVDWRTGISRYVRWFLETDR
jgi:UDP-glucose 4-epimerase